jgi:sortase (surface protein transpeptidase)
VWIPSLGINRSVSSFSCSRTRPPDNYVYRWGCAGSNNIYLMGHAYSVFKPLHDAYVSGRLHTGMRVMYADGAGRVQTYVVSFWRLVSPVGSSWAYAAQSRPSMTLQTCVGSRSQWRLIVRLVAG